MPRNTLRFLALGALLASCSSNEVRPGSNTSLCVPEDGGPPCRGMIATGPSNPTDATVTTTPVDATVADDALSENVTGTLRIYATLPPMTARAAGSTGWTVRSVPAFAASSDGGVDAGDAGVTLEAITDGVGAFTLPGVPPIATSLTTGQPSYWIAVNFPVMGNFSSMFELTADSRAVELQTFNDDALRFSLNAAGQVQADDRALIAVWVRESRAAGARPVSNVTLLADGQSSQSLYDGASGLMEVSVTGTGALGFAILPNVAVPISGDGYVTVTGPRLARPFPVRVRTRTITWLLLTAS
ncbi:MAG: hypothetical protein U0326_04150 [Polyangiales bacterium]